MHFQIVCDYLNSEQHRILFVTYKSVECLKDILGRIINLKSKSTPSSQLKMYFLPDIFSKLFWGSFGPDGD